MSKNEHEVQANRFEVAAQSLRNFSARRFQMQQEGSASASAAFERMAEAVDCIAKGHRQLAQAAVNAEQDPGVQAAFETLRDIFPTTNEEPLFDDESASVSERIAERRERIETKREEIVAETDADPDADDLT